MTTSATGLEPATTGSTVRYPSSNDNDLRKVCTSVCTENDQTDPDLAEVVNAWSKLSPPIKAAIKALIKAT